MKSTGHPEAEHSLSSAVFNQFDSLAMILRSVFSIWRGYLNGNARTGHTARSASRG
jgi:hypothetical protein